MIEETLLEAGDKMDKAVEVAKEDFASIRTGRANPGLYNKVLVDYYGSPTPLQQLASFAVPDARTILITPVRQDRPARHRTCPERLRGGRQPLQRRQRHPDHHPGPDARSAARNTSRSSSPRARTPRCPSATSAARPRKPWTSWSRTAKPARTRAAAAKRNSTPSPRQHVDGIDELLKRKEAELLEV